MEYLPPDFTYKVIFVRRDLNGGTAFSEKDAPKKRRERRRGRRTKKMRSLFIKQIQKTEEWLRGQSNIKVFFIHYNKLIKEPHIYSEKIKQLFRRATLLPAGWPKP